MDIVQLIIAKIIPPPIPRPLPPKYSQTNNTLLVNVIDIVEIYAIKLCAFPIGSQIIIIILYTLILPIVSVCVCVCVIAGGHRKPFDHDSKLSFPLQSYI